MIYLNNPEKPENFKIAGEELIPLLKEREKVKKAENNTYRKKLQGAL